ncbi:type II secretion system protein M [Stutzerimonas tarimensis]|uniref:Type II secretion system protein M n=1 Tax=Stutzerimonas tarimensis TaxID=1507735 RepID=A0ABV7T740_9GAMM
MQRLTGGLARSPLWHRWQGLSPRDRMALLALGAFVGLVVLYLAIWQPAQRSLEEARGYYAQQRDLYHYIEQNTELARQMSRVSRPTLAPDQLQGLVTATALQHGLTVESFDSARNGGLTVSLPEASSAALLDWIATLQAQGVRLDEASLQRVEDGVVTSNLTLRTGS